MGNDNKIKEYLVTKKKLNKLNKFINDLSEELKYSFDKKTSVNFKILSSENENILIEAMGIQYYERFIALFDKLSSILYGNSNSWKHRISNYINGWISIQEQVLMNLRDIQDNLTKLTSICIIGKGVLSNNERDSLQREADICAMNIIDIATNSQGPDGNPIFTNPKINGINIAPGIGAQPFIDINSTERKIMGNIQLYPEKYINEQYLYNINNNYKDIEIDLYNYFVDSLNSSNTSTLKNIDNLKYNGKNELSGKTMIPWADVRSEYYSKLTSNLINGNINDNDIIKKFEFNENSGGERWLDKNFELPRKIYITSRNNLYNAVNILINLQNTYIEYNKKQLQLAIQESENLEFKINNYQDEIINIFDEVEENLTNKIDLYSTLAISSATKIF